MYNTDFVECQALQKAVSNFLVDAINQYLKDKSFLEKDYLLDKVRELSKSDLQDSQKPLNSPADCLRLLTIPMIFSIKVKYKGAQVNIITANMTLLDFASKGFVSYIFRSKYFWGYDPVMFSLNKYKTFIKGLVKSGTMQNFKEGMIPCVQYFGLKKSDSIVKFVKNINFLQRLFFNFEKMCKVVEFKI